MVWTRRAWIDDPAEVAKAVEVWSQWLDEQTKFPRYIAKTEGESSGVPFGQRLRVALISKLGYNPESVNRTPYLRALWDYIAWAEGEGIVSVPAGVDDETEADLMRKAEEFGKAVQEGRVKVA